MNAAEPRTIVVLRTGAAALRDVPRLMAIAWHRRSDFDRLDESRGMPDPAAD